MPSDPIPPQAWERIKEFLKAERTGSITLDVKDGRVLAWKITECGRVHSPEKEIAPVNHRGRNGLQG